MKTHTLAVKRIMKAAVTSAPEADRPRLQYSVLGLNDGVVWICPRSKGDQERLRYLAVKAGLRCELLGESGTSGEYIIDVVGGW